MSQVIHGKHGVRKNKDRVAITPQKDPRLGIVCKLVEELETRGITYCHWKSNEHLLAAVSGDTDLDILFDETRKMDVIKSLSHAGFIRYRAVWYRRYPDIEDYIGIDPSCGKLVHVHAHFKLIVGEKGVKSYHLPWEKQILAARHWDDECHIYRSDPIQELLLLLVRLSLKLSLKDRLRSRFFPSYGSIAVKGGAGREHAWLRERVTLDALRQCTKQLLGHGAVGPISNLYQQSLQIAGLVFLRKEAREKFNNYRRFGKIHGLWIHGIRDAGYLLTLGSGRLGLMHLPSKRTAEGAGLVIAILGADGSGKSTQTQAVRLMLESKLDVLLCYMGSNGEEGILRKILMFMYNIFRKQTNTLETKEKVNISNKGNEKSKGSSLGSLFSVVWALALALEKRSKIFIAERLRRSGMIVICDRYPQTSVQGYNDGPLLGGLAKSRNPVLRWISCWERYCYKLSEKYPPDIVIKLIGTPEVLASRRPNMSLDYIVQKQQGIQRLNYSDKTIVVQIHADQSMSDVFSRIMTAISRVAGMRTHAVDND